MKFQVFWHFLFLVLFSNVVILEKWIEISWLLNKENCYKIRVLSPRLEGHYHAGD